MNKPLNEYSKEELIEIISSLKRQKKFGLVWEDKPEKVVKECETKLPVVKEVEGKVIEDAPGDPTNIIIEGDNYHALSVLNYTHAGKIDVIYIDPPYNTGNRDFIYNDRFVDKEDTFRHSKWLSFMEKRLRLAKNLLADDGVIFISIDDNEQANLRLLCDSVFGDNNFIANCIWTSNKSVLKQSNYIRKDHEYVIVYCRNKDVVNNFKRFKNTMSFKNIDNDPNGAWFSSNAAKPGNSNVFPIMLPNGEEIERNWKFTKEDYLAGKVSLYFKGKNVPRLKIYEKDYDLNTKIASSVLGTDATTSTGANDIDKIFHDRPFDFPKPVKLLNFLISMINNNYVTVLDFFAGSGTTGQAVMELNKEDGGHRQFILVTNNEANGKADAGAEGIAEKVTYPRIKTVITGIRPDGTKYSDGIPANLRYFKTDFVEKGKTTDDTREALITECSDMIRIRENAFEHVASAPEYRFYKNDKVFVPIIFDQFAIAETWELVEKLNTEKLPVHCYNFSYNRHANEEEIPEDTELAWTACSIPETVLEVYRKIFRKKEV